MSKWWHAATFPRALLRDAKSTRPGLLIHSKVMFARGDKGAFAYVGSANLSESAWYVLYLHVSYFWRVWLIRWWNLRFMILSTC
jgi:hypothetical protein